MAAEMCRDGLHHGWGLCLGVNTMQVFGGMLERRDSRYRWNICDTILFLENPELENGSNTINSTIYS